MCFMWLIPLESIIYIWLSLPTIDLVPLLHLWDLSLGIKNLLPAVIVIILFKNWAPISVEAKKRSAKFEYCKQFPGNERSKNSDRDDACKIAVTYHKLSVSNSVSKCLTFVIFLHDLIIFSIILDCVKNNIDYILKFYVIIHLYNLCLADPNNRWLILRLNCKFEVYQ